ncbi:hypothetical protein TWF730_004559 [Orbilia blumenaviensis]|uniref:SnoaL-like domain-containing protein n=1 Tax=Orbilia blumenaviensis TaxID=1796055 RepID=A0AAV9TZD2_9PEZI
MSSPIPPSSATELYQTIHATCIKFFKSVSRNPENPKVIDIEAVKAVRTSDFIQTFGHRFMVSHHPEYQTPVTLDTLIGQLGVVSPLLNLWDMEIEDIFIDEGRRKALVRSTVELQAEGQDKPVIKNDMVWILDLTDDGGKVRKAIEFEDSMAADAFKKTLVLIGL